MKVKLLCVMCCLVCKVLVNESCSLKVECKFGGICHLKLNNCFGTVVTKVPWGNCEKDFVKKVKQYLNMLSSKQIVRWQQVRVLHACSAKMCVCV